MEYGLIFVLLAIAYIFIVKTVLTNFAKANTPIESIFWGVLFLVTLSFLFSNSQTNSNANDESQGGCQEDDCFLYDNDEYSNSSFDDFNNDFYED